MTTVSRRQQLRRRVGVVQLHREEHDVDRADGGWIVGCRNGRYVEIALRALDAKTLRAQRRQMRAARDEGDVHADRRQPSAEVSAHAAAANDRDTHKTTIVALRPTPSSRGHGDHEQHEEHLLQRASVNAGVWRTVLNANRMSCIGTPSGRS
jgi:hypothetical protein